jgi:hypothetical protein
VVTLWGIPPLSQPFPSLPFLYSPAFISSILLLSIISIVANGVDGHPIPRSREEIAQHIADKMDWIRESLFSKEEYLADPDVLDRVLWEPVGTGHQLVIKPRSTATPSSNTADPDDPTAETPTPPPNEDDTTSPDSSDTALSNPTDAPLPDTPDAPLPDTGAATELSETPSTPAVLSIVVQLIPGASWLYPDAKWTKDNKFKSHFQDAKLVFTGGVPKHPALAPDFDASIDNLNTIMDQLGDEGNKRSTITTGQPGSAQVKIRHCLFTVRPSLSTALKNLSDHFPTSRMTTRKQLNPGVCNSVTAPSKLSSHVFIEIEMTQEWPTSNTDAAEALAKLSATHCVNPPPGLRSKRHTPRTLPLHTSSGWSNCDY